MSAPEELVRLAQAMADPLLDAAILAEGNVSANTGGETFWVKASGRSMARCSGSDFVEVRFEPLIEALERPSEDEPAVRQILNDACIALAPESIPSTEAYMHAFLLSLPNVRFAAHTHPVSLLSLLCLEDGAKLATRRLFPDEIVLCGAASCWVPYVAPGLPLALEIATAAARFQTSFGVTPKTLWLQNHGLITLGGSAKEAESASRMAIKAARVVLGAMQTGEPIRWMTDAEVQQIARWPDEHYRQRLLWS